MRIRIPEELKPHLSAEAKRRDMTVSQVVVELILRSKEQPNDYSVGN
jgi:predicted DNA-binding protein